MKIHTPNVNIYFKTIVGSSKQRVSINYAEFFHLLNVKKAEIECV
jgi:hypothetical protein